jgi:hypothetical protein
MAEPEVVNSTELSNSFLGDLIQVCVVTRDHRRTLDGMVRLGIGPWSVRTLDASNLSETTYRGAPAAFSAKLCLANSRNMNWEVVEPLSGPSIYADFLERHGEGVQHLAFNCGGLPYAERVAHFTAAGYQPIQTGLILGAIRFHYMGTEADFGSVIEIYDFPPHARLPEPESWFPAPPPA